MAKKLKITGSNSLRYNNAFFLRFHMRILALLKAFADLAKILMKSSDVDTYATHIDAMSDLTREARASVDTEQLSDTDILRDRILSYTNGIIDISEYSPNETQSASAHALKKVIDPYRNIQQLANEAETALIVGYLKDLRKDENAAHATNLHLDEALEALEEANQKYDELQKARAAKRAKTMLNVNAAELRKSINADYLELCDRIFASQMVCTEAEDLAAIQELILNINQTIEEFKTSYNMSKGISSNKKKPNEGGEDDRPVIPDEDEKPTDPEEGEGEGGEDDRPVIPDEGDEKPEPGKDENGDDLPPIE